LTSFTSFLKEETYHKENLDSIKSSDESEIKEGSSENALEEKIGKKNFRKNLEFLNRRRNFSF